MSHLRFDGWCWSHMSGDVCRALSHCILSAVWRGSGDNRDSTPPPGHAELRRSAREMREKRGDL
eukprot:2201628-Prymnesium_polylepis.1